MKPSSISSLKKELNTLPANDVMEICMKLAKFRKENKEFLSYLIFDSNNEREFIKSVKDDIDSQFNEMNKSHMFYAKKSIRKILKTTNRYIKFSGIKQTEVELLIHFCVKLKNSGIPLKSSNSLSNIFINQVQKVYSAIDKLHEDLQHDYKEELSELKLK